MREFRNNRASAITEYLGRWYNGQDNKKRPLNLLAQAANTLIPNLIGREPTHAPTAMNPALRFEATMLGLALDRLQQELDLFNLYRVVIFDALFSPCAIVKVGLRAGPDLIKISGNEYDPGQPYVCRVDFDDWTPDLTARDWAELGWESNRYRVNLDEALESGVFAGKEDQLNGLPKLGRQSNDDEHPNERTGKGDKDRFVFDTIELRDVVIYGERGTRLVTLPAGKAGESYDQFLLDTEFDGPDSGPFEHLEFHPVANQLLGVPDVAFIRDIAEASERIANKMIRQAERAKQVFAYRISQTDDAMTIKKSPDGETVGVDDPESLKGLVFGGVDKGNYEFSQYLMSTFNNASGNLQMLGGSNSASDTATEAQILQGNAMGRMREMQDRVQKFIGRVSSHLGGLIINDPLIKLPLPYRLPGGETIEVQYSAEEREGSFFDFNFKIKQGSTIGMDPMVEMSKIKDFVDELIAVFPLAQAGIVNLLAFARNIAPKYGIENADEWINDPMLMQQVMQTAAMLPQPSGPSGMQPYPMNTQAVGVTTPGGMQQGIPGGQPLALPPGQSQPARAGMARGAMSYGSVG